MIFCYKKGLLILFIILLVNIVYAADYYVWGGVGNNNNDGSAMTPDKAWATLSHADDIVGHGDTIYIKGSFGNTVFDSASTGNGDSWDKPVTYKVYGNNNVDFVLSGGDGVEFKEQKKFIIFDGSFNGENRIRMYAKEDTNCGEVMQIGADYIKITGVDFNPLNIADKCAKAIHIGPYKPEINPKSEYIYLFGNSLRNGASVSSDYRETIYIGTYNDPDMVDELYIYDNDIYNEGSFGQTYQTDVIDVKVGFESKIFIFNNNIYLSNDAGSISLGAPANVFSNYIDCSALTVMEQSGEGAVFNTYLGGPVTINLHHNIVIGGANQPILRQGGAENRYAEINVYNNIFKNFNSGTNYILEIGGSGGAGRYNFYHNTFYNSPALRGIQDSSSAIGTYNFKNNLWNTWGSYALTDRTSMTSSWDGNYYYKTGVSENDNAFTWNGVVRSFNEIQAIDQEAHGTFGINPNLDSDGKLTHSIPVKIDVSAEMSSWPDYDKDINGKTRTGAWDIGAHQYSETVEETCQSQGYQCCDSCLSGAHPEFDLDCSGKVCCEECQIQPHPEGIIEAELGTLTSPMQIITDPEASGNNYIQTTTSDEGTATYSFNIENPGIYKTIARVYASDSETNSFYVQIDSQEEDIWDINPERIPDNFNVWIEDEVTKRGTGTGTDPEYDPYLIELTTPGLHTITFRGREPNTRLDYFYFSSISECIEGDVDCNGKVELDDLILVAINFGKETSSCPECDLDDSGVIDLPDLIIVAIHFGEGS